MTLAPKQKAGQAKTESRSITHRQAERPLLRSPSSFQQILKANAALSAIALAFSGVPLAAQDIGPQASPQASLDDLIPDSAVDNPEGWAEAEEAGEEVAIEPQSSDVDILGAPKIGGPQETAPEAAAQSDGLAPLDLDNLQLPEFVPLEPLDPAGPEGPIEFAELQVRGPATAFSEAQLEEVSNGLVLAFPQTDPPFDQRSAFVERFKALSTIDQMSDDAENIAQLAAQARVDEALLKDLLRNYGYYDGRISRIVSSPDAVDGETTNEAPQVRFNVVPGTRYRFGTIDLGDLSGALDAEDLRSSFDLASGDFVQGDAILAQRRSLIESLGESGYPFAKVEQPELVVDHALEAANLSLLVQPNGKYLFGGIVSDDPEFLSGSHLETIARFDPQDVFTASSIVDLRRAIIATGLVSSVGVTPREVTAPQGEEPGVVALDVDLERGKLRTIAGALGYGSEEGVRVQASWEHRNLFPPEGALKLRGILGTQEQLGGVSFRKSNFGGRDRILTLDAFASTIDSPAFDARTVAFVASYERLSTLLFQKKSSWSVGLELIATSERPPEVDNIAEPRETFFVAALPLFAQHDTSDDLLDPTTGIRLSGELSPEISRSEGQQSVYLRSRFDLSGYQPVSDTVVIAGRVAFGAISGTELDNIAPSRRLYAGGGGSVRGFGFREIGPRDEEDDPSGGRSLVEGAIEARIQTGLLDGAVSVVPFVDAGSVSQSVRPDFAEVKFGAGLGLRYNSGFGSLRLDVGVPLNPSPTDSPVAVYVSLGQAF
jgi:translocation and assembly module TamA